MTINNHGTTETVRVQVEVRRAGRSDIDRETLVSPGSSAFYDFDDVTRLAVRVYRNSDNFRIFDDFWDADNLRQLHDTVVVDVSP